MMKCIEDLISYYNKNSDYVFNDINDFVIYFFNNKYFLKENNIYYKDCKYKSIKSKDKIKSKFSDLYEIFFIKDNIEYTNIEIIENLINDNNIVTELFKFFISKYFNPYDYYNSLNLNKLLLKRIIDIDNNITIKDYNINNYDIYLFMYYKHYKELYSLDILYNYSLGFSFNTLATLYKISITKAKEDIYKAIQIGIDYLESDIGIYSIKDILNSNLEKIAISNYVVYNNIIEYLLKNTIFKKFYKL